MVLYEKNIDPFNLNPLFAKNISSHSVANDFTEKLNPKTPSKTGPNTTSYITPFDIGCGSFY
jgi:hypothetical protein